MDSTLSVCLVMDLIFMHKAIQELFIHGMSLLLSVLVSDLKTMDLFPSRLFQSLVTQQVQPREQHLCVGVMFRGLLPIWQ